MNRRMNRSCSIPPVSLEGGDRPLPSTALKEAICESGVRQLRASARNQFPVLIICGFTVRPPSSYHAHSPAQQPLRKRAHYVLRPTARNATTLFLPAPRSAAFQAEILRFASLNSFWVGAQASHTSLLGLPLLPPNSH